MKGSVMKLAIALFSGLFLFAGADALAGQGAGGVHGTHQRGLQQFNERTDQERAAANAPEQKTDAAIDKDDEGGNEDEAEYDDSKETNDVEAGDR